MRYFSRDLERPLRHQLQSESDAIVLISGARQTGKTTLVEHLGIEKQKLVINLWDQSPESAAVKDARTLAELERYLKAFYGFEPARKTVLIIDEAQNMQASGLENVRMLSNVNASKEYLLHLILVLIH